LAKSLPEVVIERSGFGLFVPTGLRNRVSTITAPAVRRTRDAAGPVTAAAAVAGTAAGTALLTASAG
jgi:hypothetical protein